MDYSALSRKELQILAKERGIKANLSNKAIIEALLAQESENIPDEPVVDEEPSNAVEVKTQSPAKVEEIKTIDTKKEAVVQKSVTFSDDEILPFSSLNRPQIVPTKDVEITLAADAPCDNQTVKKTSFDTNENVEVCIQGVWIPAVVVKVNKASYRVKLVKDEKLVTVKHHEIRADINAPAAQSPEIEQEEIKEESEELPIEIVNPESEKIAIDVVEEVVVEAEVISNDATVEVTENVGVENIVDVVDDEIINTEEIVETTSENASDNIDIMEMESEDAITTTYDNNKDMLEKFNELTELIISNPFDEFALIDEEISQSKRGKVEEKKTVLSRVSNDGMRQSKSVGAIATSSKKVVVTSARKSMKPELQRTSLIPRKSFANTPSKAPVSSIFNPTDSNAASKPPAAMPKTTNAQKLKLEMLHKKRLSDAAAKQAGNRQKSFASKRASVNKDTSMTPLPTSSSSLTTTTEVKSVHKTVPIKQTPNLITKPILAGTGKTPSLLTNKTPSLMNAAVNKTPSFLNGTANKTPIITAAIAAKTPIGTSASINMNKEILREKTVAFNAEEKKIVKSATIPSTVATSSTTSSAKKSRSSVPNFSKSHENMFNKSKPLTALVKKDNDLAKKMDDAFEKANSLDATSAADKENTTNNKSTTTHRINPKDVRASLASTHKSDNMLKASVAMKESKEKRCKTVKQLRQASAVTSK